jgi:hypothetical protein
MCAMAPDHVDLVYRKVGDHHIFASKGIQGLVHVGHTDLERAYDDLLRVLNFHVTRTYGVEARYICDAGFDGLRKKIEADGECLFVEVVLDPHPKLAA